MPEQEIQIIIRRDTINAWLLNDNNEHILADGEPAAVWKVRTGPDGLPLFAADGVTPLGGKLLYQVIGDGFSRFSQLDPLWPVPKGAFNSIVSNRQGTGRNLESITQTNATHSFDTLADFIDNLAHPYAPPAFTSFNPASFPDREVGTPLPRNFTFSWSTSNSQNMLGNSVSITQNFGGTNTTLASGLAANGSFTPSGLAPLVGTALGQTATFYLDGTNTRDGDLSATPRTAQWLGRRALFLHPDTEWLCPGMSAKVGETPGTYVSSDATVAALINAALDTGDSALGNGSFGLRTLDGGTAGKRAYLAYPADYRTVARFIDPSFNVDQAAVKVRLLPVTRNGLTIPYALLGLDLRIVQTFDSYIQ